MPLLTWPSNIAYSRFSVIFRISVFDTHASVRIRRICIVRRDAGVRVLVAFSFNCIDGHVPRLHLLERGAINNTKVRPMAFDCRTVGEKCWRRIGLFTLSGVQHLIAFCLNDACRHTALIDVSSYPAETEVPCFKSRVVCISSRAGSTVP